MDGGARLVGVQLVDGRHEHDVDAFGGGDRGVTVGVPGVGVEVLVGSELGRVHEEADDDEVGVGARGAHERPVAVVEVPHGGDERDGPPGAAGVVRGDGG